MYCLVKFILLWSVASYGPSNTYFGTSEFPRNPFGRTAKANHAEKLDY